MKNTLFQLPEDVNGYSLGLAHDNYAVVVAEETTNLIPNPSFENATLWSTGWTTAGGTAWAAATNVAARGRVSARQSGSNGSIRTNPGISCTAGLSYTFSVDVKGVNGETVTLSAENGAHPNITAAHRMNGRWQRVHLTFIARVTGLYVLRVTGSRIYVDGAQFEQKNYPTTYCDGDVRGFGIVSNEYRWDTVAHNSISYRSASTRHGGRIVPLGGGKNVHVVMSEGLGAPAGQMTVATLYDGTAYVSQAQSQARTFTLGFALYAETPKDLRETRRGLINLLTFNPSNVPQPMVMLIYPTTESGDNDGDPLIVYCHYAEGLEGMRSNFYSERIGVRFQSVSPYMVKEYGEVQQFGTFATPPTAGQVMYRSPRGEWTMVTPNATQYEQYDPLPNQIPNSPMNTVGFLGETVVMGGGFLNAEGVAAYDYLFAWNPSTATKSAVGDGVNGRVDTLQGGKLTHRGKLFISGNFSANAAGSVTARRVAVHQGGAIGTALTFPAVGLGGAGVINAFAFHPNGRIYVGGDFSTLSNSVSVPGLAWMHPTTYTLGALNLTSTIVGGFTWSATVGPDELVYFGGMNGYTVDGVFVGPVISYNPVTGKIIPLGQRLIGYDVYALEFGADGYLYAAGQNFTQSNGRTGRFLARYNGFEWDVMEPDAGATPGGYLFYDLYGARGMARIGDALYLTGGFNNPSDSYARFIGGRMVAGDITIPHYGTWDIESSEGGALAFNLFAGNPVSGEAPWVKPTNMTAYPALVTDVVCEEASEWDLYVVGPCVLDSFSNFTTNSHLFFSPYTVVAGEYVRVSLFNNRIVAKSSRGDIPVGNFVSYADVPGRMALVDGTNHLQLALHNYNATTTKVSIGTRRRIKGMDYA